MKYKIFILFFLVSFSLGSCKKYLEVDPKNQRPLTTVNDVKLVLAGYLKVIKPGETTTFHATLGDVMFIQPSYWSMFEYYSDNIDFQRDYSNYVTSGGPVGGKDFAKLILINNFSAPTAMWVQHYKSIGFLNVLLDALDKATGDQHLKEQLKGEMLVCRAMYYFKLLQYFAPYKDDAQGIPVYTDVVGPFAGLSIPRSSQKEVFQFIIGQLTEAANFGTNPDLDYNVLYNKTYIRNFLAQVYWYKAESGAKETTDYSNAKNYAQEALNGIILPATYDDYVKSLSGNYANSYPIYQRWGGSSTFSEQTYGQPNGTAKFTPHASPSLLSIFNTADFRYKAYIKADSTIVRPMETSPKQFTTAYSLFRPEEAYMINMEATLKSGGTESEVRTLLNNFRRLRGINTDFTGTDLNQEIINERRREFCFHTDLRWLDMKRYGIGLSRNSMLMFGQTLSVSVLPNGYHYALPIPVNEELRLNTAMTANPSWIEILF